MTKSTKKKHVVSEILINGHRSLEKDEIIVRIVNGRGNNLHEVVEVGDSSSTFLVSMPTRFRKTVWVKRGDYVIIQPIEEGDKVKGEITEILNKDRIKFLKQNGVWPKFEEEDTTSEVCGIPENPNRNSVPQVESDSSESSE